ncbi:A/G-specific adenine glycosylase [Ammoniphilus resinae]|uniref:Adenine DNA glycosylase n=1 Tax=Ammoniphilus resinae TaxID=861532 RepID=A0ABS4GJ13_9BACL|nr:A/G-specific adenine glycosylase [Ammoniphilus resinae]MBP1930245.1 A/G-specific adenine glycosylase [Ammoniphilus resinae]
MTLTGFQTEQFQHDLLYWFERNLRDLPWRKDRDPYKIWVSEIMLQQTRVDTVIPYFERFMQRFPSIDRLAEADLDDVIKQWEGLGYYSRARNLHAGVKEVQENYAGKVPDEPDKILEIKGIGPYTAGAILSIAYDKPEPAVDGNVMRVLSRILHIEDDIQKAKTRKRFEAAIREIISVENPSFFNQALMELGALICSPKSPKCEYCPVVGHCRAKKLGIQELLPVKGKAKPPKPLEMKVALLDRAGKILIRKRPEQGLLAGLWELPNVEGTVDQLLDHLHAAHHISGQIRGKRMEYQHTFSHLQWKMEVYEIEVDELDSSVGEVWVARSELDQYSFPVAFQKILAETNPTCK